MKKQHEHYDGDAPQKPLPAAHFTPEEQADARDLGDGSPGIEPRPAHGREKETGSNKERDARSAGEG